jgi:hypothetical protein
MHSLRSPSILRNTSEGALFRRPEFAGKPLYRIRLQWIRHSHVSINRHLAHSKMRFSLRSGVVCVMRDRQRGQSGRSIGKSR